MILNETELETELIQLALAHLPYGSELLAVNQSSAAGARPAIVHADLDGDGQQEIAAAYRWNGSSYVLVLAPYGNAWSPIAHLAGPGYGISLLLAAPVNPSVTRPFTQPVTQSGRSNLVVGWQAGAIWSRVSIYEWTPLGMKDRASDRALGLQQPYPSKDTLLRLQQLAQLQQPNRWLERDDARDAHDAHGADEMYNVLDAAEVHAGRARELFPAPQKTITGTHWGYIGTSGDWLIRPQFEYAADFQDNGYAVVQIKGFSGIIDASGKYVVPPTYNSISPFTEGRAIVIDKQGFKVINEKGQALTSKPYNYISSYSNGRAAFALTKGQGSERYGYLDLQGKEVIPATFLNAGDFRDGKAVVKLKDKEYALIRLDGKRIATYPYAFVGALGNGLLPFQKVDSGKYGYINERGKEIIAPQYTLALSFEDGAAVVNTAEDYRWLYGLIDRDANFLIKPLYNAIRPIGRQRVAVGKAIDPKQPFIGSQYAIGDTEGKLLTDFQYYDVADYKNGLASVTDGNQTFFIDRTGQAAQGYPRVEGSGALAVMGSLIQANVDQRLSYLERSGQVIWRQNTVIPLRLPYLVKEHKYKPNKDYLVYYPQVEGMGNLSAERQVNEKLRNLSQVKDVPANVQLDYSYTGDFNVAFFQKNLLELELEGYNFPYGAAHGMPTRVYTHINLVNGRSYELKDLFKPGSDYTQVLSAIVAKQIKEDPQYEYVFPDTYKGIRADQPFYVTSNALYLYFEPYEIAPYVAGFPTFTIPFSSIMDIIAVTGEFWRSFQRDA
jgi:hypothetical protein